MAWLGGWFGFILTGPLIGYEAETRGLTVALNALAFSWIVMFVIGVMPLIRVVIVLQMKDA